MHRTTLGTAWLAGAVGFPLILAACGLNGTDRYEDQQKAPAANAAAAPDVYEEAFTEARYNAANVDIGHWTATQNASPLPFITKHHDRIPHIHVKDRKLGTNGGENTPFGQGDTAIRPILQAIRDNKWKIRPIIEFEYKVPEGSTRTAEIKKSLDYCRDALMA